MQPNPDPSKPRLSPDVPNFIDENPNLESVRDGLDVAEDERRESAGVDPADDEGEEYAGDPIPPEVAAIRSEI